MLSQSVYIKYSRNVLLLIEGVCVENIHIGHVFLSKFVQKYCVCDKKSENSSNPEKNAEDEVAPRFLFTFRFCFPGWQHCGFI